MTGVPADLAVTFDDDATPGAWGPVLRAAAAQEHAAVRKEEEPLRVRVHQLLRARPLLTARETAVALGLGTAAGPARVGRALAAMESDGEARRSTGRRAPSDRSTTVRWEAT